jgi:hypothetical protein
MKVSSIRTVVTFFIEFKLSKCVFMCMWIDRPVTIVRRNGETTYIETGQFFIDAAPTAVPVDRRVRHLETQLRRQLLQRDGRFARIFNSGSAAESAANARGVASRTGNEYVDFRSWFRTIGNCNAAAAVTSAAVLSTSASGEDADTAPLDLVDATATPSPTPTHLPNEVVYELIRDDD